jgi:hypothetical protein
VSLPNDRPSRPCALDCHGGRAPSIVRPYWLGPRPARRRREGFLDRSGAVATLGRASVQRRRPGSACASAHRPVTAPCVTGRIRERTHAGTAGRSATAGPVDRARHRCASEYSRSGGTPGRAARTFDRTPLLRFSSPSALAGHARAPGDAIVPAIPLRRCPAPSSSCPPSAWQAPFVPTSHRAPTHRRRLLVPAVFQRVAGVGPVDSARIDAARFGRDAPVFAAGSTASIPHRPRRGSCAGAAFRPAFRYPRHGSRGLVGPLSASRSVSRFPSREPGPMVRSAGACHACDGDALDALSRRRSWGFRLNVPSQV